MTNYWAWESSIWQWIKIFIWTLKTMRKAATTLLWICWPSWTNCVIHTLGHLGLDLLVWSELEQYGLSDQYEILERNSHMPLVLCVEWPLCCTLNIPELYDAPHQCVLLTKFLQGFKHLTCKNLHKKKLDVNWHAQYKFWHVVWLVKNFFNVNCHFKTYNDTYY